jgi:predicted nucleic acid-binding protein
MSRTPRQGAIAAITLTEFTAGVQLATTRQRPRRQSYVNEIAAAIPIMPYNEPVALHHANLLLAVRRTAGPAVPTTSSSQRPRPRLGARS